MAEESVITRRWNGFVCPACRRIFRVATDHDGRGVVCPGCRSMLRLPEDGDTLPPLVHERANRRRSPQQTIDESERRALEIFDETFAEKGGTDVVVFRAVMASVVTVVVLILAGVFWPRSDQPSGAPPELDEVPYAGIQQVDPKDEVRMITVSLIRDDLEPVVKAFLNADTREEMMEWISRPERAAKRMDGYYADGFVNEGFRSVLQRELGRRTDKWARITVEVDDFTRRPMWLRKNAKGWQVDWESWVGWSPLSWEELKARKPTAPMRVRAFVSPVIYFNFDFNDETEWACFTLRDPEDADVLYGYVPRASELHNRISNLHDKDEKQMLLEVRFPDDAMANNQVVLDQLFGDGWLETEDAP